MSTSKDAARKPGPTKNQVSAKAPNASAGQKTPAGAAGSPRPGIAPGKGAPVTNGRNGATGRPVSGARPTANGRPGAQRRPGYPPKKSGFRMRPLDMIITGVAVLVIGFIIWAVWSSASGGTAATPADPNAPDAHTIPNGTQAPDFTLPGTDGKTYSLSQFKGSPVFVEFMAPWCPHCQDDAPVLNQVYAKYHDKGLQMIGVNASPFGHNYETGDKSPITMEDQKWFVDTFKLPYPLLFDKPITASDGSPDTTQRPIYGVDYFPTIYLIDKDGKIAAHMLAEANNPITVDRISGEVDKLLK